MPDTSVSPTLATVPSGRGVATEATSSAVSWGAISAGAVVAAATSLVLLALGSGLGFASLSPWPGSSASPTTFTIVAALWLIVVQWASSGVGGYITGRLRTKWVNLHTHEVFFRDTAHGFLAWAVATVIALLLLASTASSVVGTSVRTASTIASAGVAAGLPTRDYDIDLLFRPASADAATAAPSSVGQAPSRDAARREATRILAVGMTGGDLSAGDRTYLAQLAAANAGISQDEAQKRVDDVVAREKAAEAKALQAADVARKAASAFAIFTALSMLVGAFIACVAAALGGHRRDEHL